jgi:hypothetical protein
MKKRPWEYFAVVGARVTAYIPSTVRHSADNYEISGHIVEFLSDNKVAIQTDNIGDLSIKVKLILHRREIYSITIPLPLEDPLYGISTASLSNIQHYIDLRKQCTT